MSRECRRARRHWMSAQSTPEWLHEHVEPCDECARFGTRLSAVRRGLAQHHAGIEPDAGFVNRVMARSARHTAETLGWAAARLLPIGLALALALAWISWSITGNGGNGGLSNGAPTEDPLSWVLEENGDRS